MYKHNNVTFHNITLATPSGGCDYDGLANIGVLPPPLLSDRFLRFHSSKCTVAFLSRNVVSHPYPSILHTLTPISDFSDEQRETTIQLLHQVELDFPKWKWSSWVQVALGKWLTSASSTRASSRELLGVGAWNDPRFEMTPGSFYPSVQ